MMKRISILGSKRGRSSTPTGESSGTDAPEFNAPRAVRKFCESAAAPGQSNAQNDEAVHLPVIVESCESSPQAASAAAYQIRKFLSKDNNKTPFLQYNAFMLIRILADNPGPLFTKNIDSKFVTAVKDLLKNQSDPSVQHLVRETMAWLATEKKADTNLEALLKMWDKEKNTAPPQPANSYVRSSRSLQVPAPSARSSSRVLPPPPELAGRIHEARTSAQLLNQIVISTPAPEFAYNELIREFADRCAQAQRNMQQYMNATEPAPPDEATFKTLIETSEQLGVAMSRHQRAVLASRQAAGPVVPPQQSLLGQQQQQFGVPAASQHPAYAQPQPQQPANSFAPQANPFADPARIGDPQQEKQSATFSSQEVYDDNVSPPPGPPPNRRAAPAPPPPRLSNLPQTPPNPARVSEDDLYGTSPAVVRRDADPKSHDFASQRPAHSLGIATQPGLDTNGEYRSFADHSGRNWGDASPLENDMRQLTLPGDQPSSNSIAAPVVNATAGGKVVRDDDPITPRTEQAWRQ